MKTKQLILMTGLFLSSLLLNTLAAQPLATTRAAELRREFLDTESKRIMVAAHRGDWRNAPENSIDALEKCIAMGVDIVETDLARTKDGELIIMHDRTLDRTTTGKGKVEEHTLAEVKALFLRNGAGHATAHRVPTFREFMLAAKGRILINLDKSWQYWPQVREVLAETGTLEEVVMKAWVSVAEVERVIGEDWGRVMFMPVIELTEEGAGERLRSYLATGKTHAYEIVFAEEAQFAALPWAELRASKVRIWVNTLWPALCAGRDDDRAETEPDASYGWLIENGATLIQTDRPALLIGYLAKKGLR